MAVETTPFDAAEYLDSIEKRAAYLSAVLEENDPDTFRNALNTVARAEGMTKLANASSVSRQGLYKALGPDGDPQFATVLSAINALGLSLEVKPTTAD